MSRVFLNGIDPASQLPDEHIDPSDHGYDVWSFDPAIPTASSTPSAGILTGVKLYNRVPVTISQLATVVFTAGASLSNVGFALYSAAGALLTSSVNANGATTSAFTTTGIKLVTFTTPQAIPAGGFYAAMWFAGTTPPTLMRGASALSMFNLGLTAPNLRFFNANTGLTNAAPATIGTQSAAAAAWWIAAT